MQRTITLKAGIPTPIDVLGRQFVALSWSVETVTRFTMRSNKGGIVQEFETSRRFDVTLPEDFEQVMVTATVDTVLEFIISDGTVRFDFVDGIRVRATIEGQPISVVPDRGAPGNPVYVSGITYSDAPATQVNNGVPVNVTHVVTGLQSANAARRRAVWVNDGPDPVGIGGTTGMSWANRTITLEVGDMWIEDRAANLAWSAVCESAGKTATVRNQTVAS
jgi:hypothetical protein